MNALTDWLLGFWTWQTPLSFMAGVGAHHIYCKYFRDKESTTVFRKKLDGTYAFSQRFWVVAAICAVLFAYIGWSTQNTANKVEDQAYDTAEFASQTQHCLNQLADTIRVRTEFNTEDASLNAREREALQNLFTDALTTPLGDQASVQGILDEYFAVVNQVRAERQEVADKRAANPYPDPACGQRVPE